MLASFYCRTYRSTCCAEGRCSKFTFLASAAARPLTQPDRANLWRGRLSDHHTQGPHTKSCDARPRPAACLNLLLRLRKLTLVAFRSRTECSLTLTANFTAIPAAKSFQQQPMVTLNFLRSCCAASRSCLTSQSRLRGSGHRRTPI